MKTISAIYRSVRHHLHDDWAYGNDLDAKPWDFGQQEFALKASIEQFNARYYHPNSPPVPSINSPNALHAEGPAANGEVGSAVEEEPLVPLDHHYLSAVGKEVCVCLYACVCRFVRVCVCLCMYVCKEYVVI